MMLTAVTTSTHVANFGDLVNYALSNPGPAFGSITTIIGGVITFLKLIRDQNVKNLQDSLTSWKDLAEERGEDKVKLERKIEKFEQKMEEIEERDRRDRTWK